MGVSWGYRNDQYAEPKNLIVNNLFLVAANPDQEKEQRILDTNAGKQLS
jgi:hypothetical protein